MVVTLTKRSGPLADLSPAYRYYLEDEIHRLEMEALYNRICREHMNDHKRRQSIATNNKKKTQMRRNESEARLYNALVDQQERRDRDWAWEQQLKRLQAEEDGFRRQMIDRQAEFKAEQDMTPLRDQLRRNRAARDDYTHWLENEFAGYLSSAGLNSGLSLYDKLRDKDRLKHERQRENWLVEVLGLEKRREEELRRGQQWRRQEAERHQEGLRKLQQQHRHLVPPGARQQQLETVRRLQSEVQDVKLGLDDVDAGRERQLIRLGFLGRDHARLNSQLNSLTDNMRRSALYYGWKLSPDSDLDFPLPAYPPRRPTSIYF